MGTIFRALGALLLLASLAAAQDVQSTLYTRVEGDTVRAAIEVDIQFGWHIYHTEKGHPEAAATPTTVELSGTGITWEKEVVFPEPHMDFQGIMSAAGDEELWAWTHEGTIVLYAQGTLAAGADGADAAATVAGLVCMESCMPFRNEITTQGAGADALFASFPEFGGGAPADQPAEEETEAAPSVDVIASGQADTTLYTRVEGNRIRAALEVKIGFGYHLYHSELGHSEAIGKPTVVELKGDGITWGPVEFPAPEELDQGIPAADGEGNIWIWSHAGTIVLHAEGALAPGAKGEGVWGVIKGQTCDDMACVNYEETFVSAGPGLDELFPATNDEESADDMRDGGLWLFLLSCIGGGLFALMMPCTYPMIPITISYFTKQADARKGNVLPLSLAYGGGIVLIFILIGVFLGAPIIKFATHYVTNLVIGALFLYFALVLFGLITMQPPRFMMKAVEKAQTTGGLLGIFLMGATLVISSFTCTAPIMGSILALGGRDGDLLRLVIGMGVFGLTMAIPFVLLSLVPGRIQAMPKSGEWMNTLKFFLGFVEVAAAMKFFSNADVFINEGAKWLPRTGFLAAWGVIFLLSALFLFGVIFRHGGSKPGGTRLAVGVLALAFAGYNAYGATGKPLDVIMTAIAPPFSEAAREEFTTWRVIEDDYDKALEVARAEGKLVLVNFTGHT